MVSSAAWARKALGGSRLTRRCRPSRFRRRGPGRISGTGKSQPIVGGVGHAARAVCAALARDGAVIVNRPAAADHAILLSVLDLDPFIAGIRGIPVSGPFPGIADHVHGTARSGVVWKAAHRMKALPAVAARRGLPARAAVAPRMRAPVSAACS